MPILESQGKRRSETDAQLIKDLISICIIVIVNREGNWMKVMKTLILLKGDDLLDEMFEPDKILEIVEFYEEYKPVGPLSL